MRARWVAVLVAAGAACTWTEDRPCRVDTDCGGGRMCVAERCVGASDGSIDAPLVGDGSPPDAPSDRDASDAATDDTDAGTHLGAPELRSPHRGARTGSVWDGRALRPTFRWSSIAGASHYELDLARDCDAAACSFARATRLNASVPALTPTEPLTVATETRPVGSRYAWRVRACDAATCGPWSDPSWLDVGRIDGDFDGDGYEDLAIGADAMRAAAGPLGGLVFVFHGERDAWASGYDDVMPRATLSEPTPRDDARFGAELASGDFNGDGYSDLAVGAPGGAGAGTPAIPGRVHVFFGSLDGLARTPSTLGAPVGAERAEFGGSLAALGDPDGDGFDDLAIGAARYAHDDVIVGAVFVARGSPLGLGGAALEEVLSPSDEISGFASVAGGGDLDGDGFTDLAVGAPLARGEMLSGAGAVHIYLGGADVFSVSPDHTLASPTPAAREGFGARLLAGCDASGDGVADLLVAAPGYVPPATARVGCATTEGLEVGRTYVLGLRDGATELTGIVENPNPCASESSWGQSMACLRDFDGDGASDFVVGAPRQLGTRAPWIDMNVGAIIVVPSAPMASAIVFEGDDDDGRFGRSVAGIALDAAAVDRVFVGSPLRAVGGNVDRGLVFGVDPASPLLGLRIALGAPDGAIGTGFGRALAP